MSLRPRAAAAIGPWGDDLADAPGWIDAGCPVPDDRRSPIDLPMVPGFIESRFNPLVHRAMAACLGTLDPASGSTTGVVLASVLGDTTTADRASVAVAAGRRPQPLLFYQSVPTSVLGHVSAAYGITGPMVCVSGTSGLYADAVETADLMLAEPEVSRVLLVYVDIGAEQRPLESLRQLESHGEQPAPGYECCVAVLVDADGYGKIPAPPSSLQPPHPLAGFLALAGVQPDQRQTWGVR
ncbi:beta-ketoacyl synthase chain length factor [Symbioplanes lichenis]|uniref:beta-ketoacyl synthase chain length factor n=1 Tax=Symbioplanes lichenis TaxID=1629072 RepID=UPI00273A245F|nr:beta-ketoacyl synthase chain length factor [Actinoplanes lichenis]